MIQAFAGLSILLCTSIFIHYVMLRTNARLNERIQWLELRCEEGPTSNWNMCVQLEKQVRRLNRRVVNLLESPKTYLRARRITSTLDLPVDELTAELELLCLVEAERDRERVTT